MYVTPVISAFTCPTALRYVVGCDMGQSWVEGVSICMWYIQYAVAMTPLSLSGFACPMSHHFTYGCDMGQSWAKGVSIYM